jgi:CheY-like chemotaxis protein
MEPTDSDSRRTRRIVVTDDDPRLLTRVVRTLRSAGYCVFAAYDGASACELALLIPELDLLITNTRLGDISGRELILHVRERRPELPILHLGDPLADPDGRLNDVPSLREPFTPEQLIEAAGKLAAKPAR